MLEDRGLRFGNRTAVDLKDKYRNMVKKGSIIEDSFKVTLIERDENDYSGRKDSIREKQERRRSMEHIRLPNKNVSPSLTEDPSVEIYVSSSESKYEKDKEVLPVLRSLRATTEGKIECIMSMKGLEERIVQIEDVPISLLPIFEQYKRDVKDQLDLANASIVSISDRSVSPTKTKSLSKPVPSSSSSSSSSSCKQPEGTDEELPIRIIDKKHDDAWYETQTTPKRKKLPPPSSGVMCNDELEAKKSRLINTMKRARQSSKIASGDRNCLVQ